MNKLTIGLAALAIATGGAAYADHHKAMGGDADGDGVVTRSEAQAHAGQMFARMDANNDGKLDQSDRTARQEQRRTKMFEALDGDNNGQISREEFMTFKHEGKRGKWGEGRKRGEYAGKRSHAMMRMADTNNDGAISKTEFTAAAMRHFDKADADNDGKVTAEERQAAHREMRAKQHERMSGKAPD